VAAGRSQRVAAASAAVVVLGVGAALLIRFVVGPAASPGRLPRQALALPDDALLLVGVEVAELRRAGLAEKIAPLLPALPPELEGAGKDALAAVDRLFYAAPREDGSTGVGVVLGRFDAEEWLERLVTAGAERRDGRVWLEQGGNRIALAAAGEGALLFGDAAAVDATARALADGEPRLDLERLEPTLDALPATAAAWGAVGREALGSLKTLASGSRLPLPPLPPLVGAGIALDVQAMPTFDIVALAEDEDGARRFAETAAGGLALAQLSAPAEWRELLQELALGREGTVVRLRARIPVDRLETLTDLIPTRDSR